MSAPVLYSQDMLFNSLQFILFFIVVVAVYFWLPPRVRWILLLLASYYFYMSWKPEYAVLLLATTLIDYLVALLLERLRAKRFRIVLLCISLASNFGMLFLFKYYTFVSDSLRGVLDAISMPTDIPSMQLLLPVGISFYTFQTVSYVIDVYRRTQRAERHFGYFALYITFFPQLVAGPIERASHILPQLRRVNTFEYRRVAEGLKLIAWGLFKKVVIADRLAELVNLVYNNPSEHAGVTILLATYFFAFQIYCDFSGYSDIAIGTARVLGYDLMQNFNRPYLAQNITDFWRRWHISLSTWLRDYVYYPLGGNRLGLSRQYVNLLITFLASGIWHGANWTFVLWGLLHGAYNVIGRLTLPLRDRLYKRLAWSAQTIRVIRVMITFHLVSVGWVLFRANSLRDAGLLFRNLFARANWDGLVAVASDAHVMLSLVWIGVLVASEVFFSGGRFQIAFSRQPALIRWAGYAIITAVILLFGKAGGNDFIYFQF